MIHFGHTVIAFYIIHILNNSNNKYFILFLLHSLDSVNLYSLVAKLESADHNVQIARLKIVVSKLIKLLNKSDVISFNLDKFLASFLFVEIQKRVKGMILK